MSKKKKEYDIPKELKRLEARLLKRRVGARQRKAILEDEYDYMTVMNQQYTMTENDCHAVEFFSRRVRFIDRSRKKPVMRVKRLCNLDGYIYNTPDNPRLPEDTRL